MIRTVLLLTTLFALPAAAQAASAPEPADQATVRKAPLFGRERMRTFVLANFDRFASTNAALPALRKDTLRFMTQSFRPNDVTFVLESFSGLFPGTADETTDNAIEIYDADYLSVEVAKNIFTINEPAADLIVNGIKDGTLCWSGQIPANNRLVPIILVSEKSDASFLSKCLYRGAMAHMGVQILYKDSYPTEGRLNAIMSHMANITAVHIFFECRQHIRKPDLPRARACVEQRLDELY